MITPPRGAANFTVDFAGQTTRPMSWPARKAGA